MRKLICLFGAVLFLSIPSFTQIRISGTVFDKSKVNYVEGVKVFCSNGTIASTDSIGHYSILASIDDTLSFFHNGKFTRPFLVESITTPLQFDISLQTSVESKYQLIREVKVFSKSYRQDSLENRERYREIFGYEKPGIRSSMSETGLAGADLDEIINMFRFRRNKNLKAFRQRLLTQEQEKFIDYRFSPYIVKRITGLQQPQLDSFMRIYRPDYAFASNSSDVAFHQYILNCYYEFSGSRVIKQNAKDEAGLD